MRRSALLAGGLTLGLSLAGCGGGGDATPAAGVEEPEVLSAPADDTSGDTIMEPEADRLADPCADHQGREADVFIDLVVPIDEQVATGGVEIVGCANVNEATVAWSLLDGDGRTLDEGSTTAECGTGCVGAFRDTVPLSAVAGEPVAYLQVFAPDVADDGPARLQLTEVVLIIG